MENKVIMGEDRSLTDLHIAGSIAYISLIWSVFLLLQEYLHGERPPTTHLKMLSAPFLIVTTCVLLDKIMQLVDITDQQYFTKACGAPINILLKSIASLIQKDEFPSVPHPQHAPNLN